MLESMMKSPIAWGVLSLFAVFSTLFAVYTWVVGKKVKELSFVCKTNEVIASGKSKIEKLFIQYGGENIDDLSISQFFIWNSGNEVINKSDIVESRPLSIISSEAASILDAQIIRTNEETNALSLVRKEKHRIVFNFDYLEPGNGFVVQIVHTGQAIELDFDCKIKGGKELRDISSIKRKRDNTNGDGVASFLLGIIPPVLGLICYSICLSLCFRISHNESIPRTVGIPLTIILMLGGAVPGYALGKLILNTINRTFHRTIPQSLIDQALS